MSRILLVWNPVSTDVSSDTVGSVLVKLAERHDVVAMHTLGPNDGVRLGRLAADEGYEALC